MIAKLKVKKIKILGLIIISCFITLSFVKVDALELNYSGKPNAKVKKVSSTCDSKASSCKDITSKYSISIQNPNDNPNDNREKVVVKYTATKPTGFSSAPTANDFNVYVMINDTDGGIESFYKQAGSFTKVGSYYTMEFYITPTSNDQDLNVFVASANNEKCCEMPETDVRNIVNLYNLGHDLSPIKKSNGNIIDEYKGMHIDSRTITHTVDMEEIDYDYDSEYVADSALEYIEPFVSESGSPIVKPAGTEDRTNGSKDIAVKCDTFAINNKHCDGSSVSYAKDGQEYFINKKYYYSKEESDEQKDMGVCHKECEELISVEYGPPVASIGGFCFEYVVKVTSKQYCNTRFEGSKPDKSRFKTCTIYPKCNNSEQYSDQAGPNQDFDDCIMDCDGGKYTEKCTNKCYSKVYEETDSKLSLNYLDKEVNVASLAGTYNILTDKAVAVNTGNATTIKDLAKNNHPSGGYYYRASASEIAWNQDGAPYWLRAGRYYWGTTSRAERNLKLVSETGAGELRGGVWRHYFIDDGGFRRACKAGTSNNQHNCTNGCNEKCDWLVYSNGYCNTANLIGSNLNEYYLSGTKTDTIASRTYYNVRNANKATPATGSDKNQNSIYVFMNKEDTDYVYAAKVSEYKKEKKECEAATTCEKTHQSQFTISVDAGGNKNFPLEGTDIISTSNTWTGRVTNSSTILNENNGICMNPHDGSPYHYDVEWSFPGTWINNKNGDISYTSKENSAGLWK